MSDSNDSTPIPARTDSSRRGIGALLSNRNFRLLWLGQATSLLGDQFAMIALPWLVLRLTPDPLALGIVMALAGIPRALFMLVGGAASDRLSPRMVMLVSDAGRLVLTIVFVVIVVTGIVQLWMVYALSLLFGFISGFFLPASSSMLPRLIGKEQLQSGNALYQGTAQLTVFVGPVVAGGLVALVDRGGGAGFAGIGVAFVVDALTFVVSIATLWFMRVEAAGAPDAGERSVAASIAEGFRYVWSDPLLRITMILVAAINFLFVGPFIVGIPYLSKVRFPEGVAAFGIIMSAYGGGNLAGYLLSGMLSRVRKTGATVVLVIALFGVGTIAMGYIGSTALAFAVILSLGVGNGFIGIVAITWLQRRVTPTLMGRVMSLLILFNVGLVPISQALSGALLGANATLLFVGAGLLMLVTCLPFLSRREFREEAF